MQTYTVNYRNAFDRLRVRMNIILFFKNFCHVLKVLVQRFFNFLERFLHLWS